MAFKTVFLSSTARDLIEYRDTVYKALESTDGYHCVRMEDFGARSWKADEFCRAKVTACDIFVGLIGHLYGSIPERCEDSFTEREYKEAAGIPRLMFLAADDILFPANLIEPEESRRRQQGFRTQVRRDQVCPVFTHPLQLASQVVTALVNLERESRAPSKEVSTSQPTAAEAGAVTALIPGRTILLAGAECALVTGGEFSMGSDDGYPHEQPRHTVSVSSFFLKTTPVTNQEFRRFVNETGYVTTAEIARSGLCFADGEWQITSGADFRHPTGPDSSMKDRMNHPVVEVSWFDAKEYCVWLSKVSGFHFDLPTEAQWEYAATGPEGRIWSFGNTYSKRQANLEGQGTSPVGRFPPNEFALYDMTGNVYEWCSDWFAPTWVEAGHHIEAITKDPKGSPSGTARVLRGGSWFDNPYNGRCANRFFTGPPIRSSNWGLRFVLLLTNELLVSLLSNDQWGLNVQQMLRRED